MKVKLYLPKNNENARNKSVHQLKSKRFEVSLPFKSAPSNLDLSYETAQRRFPALERRLLKDPVTREMYNDFMKEYLNISHMSATNADFSSLF